MKEYSGTILNQTSSKKIVSSFEVCGAAGHCSGHIEAQAIVQGRIATYDFTWKYMHFFNHIFGTDIGITFTF